MVTFGDDVKDKKADDKSDDSEEEDVLKTSHIRLSDEDRDMIIKNLTKEFVESKKKKLRCCVSFYIWLNRTFSQQLIFKNNRQELKELN